MEHEDRRLVFEFDGDHVGCFEGIDGYPTTPGKYRYMPFRGPGHYEMREACARRGSARCSYRTAEGVVEFTARPANEYGALEISDIAARAIARVRSK
jgi:hypothetical protein